MQMLTVQMLTQTQEQLCVLQVAAVVETWVYGNSLHIYLYLVVDLATQQIEAYSPDLVDFAA